eukprot:CAMPEP_0175840706 /NCGR_PEP_ID=MMETSP0107_2-20121207/19519_1 /TAXON_ID=195067 ORGANISM="Goniomonas pacifica, Strain CCMP1869" /NCGR_SAMPLE_ID=MMETSP0107_2 /ASSEMBLY_ACC=CAM_ASM_000203 /LENGTH=65 /DNA_ID=CAMNT_0017154585 /DNA_START=274 /DNA_END=468 /DNA_ORIENTATION=-
MSLSNSMFDVGTVRSSEPHTASVGVFCPQQLQWRPPMEPPTSMKQRSFNSGMVKHFSWSCMVMLW